MNFLRTYGLQDEFKLNIECNHATLAGHSCDHELQARPLLLAYAEQVLRFRVLGLG